MYGCVRTHMYALKGTQRATYEYVYRPRHTVRLLQDEVMYVCACILCMYVCACMYAYVRWKGTSRAPYMYVHRLICMYIDLYVCT
jgi:hypothetical protein